MQIIAYEMTVEYAWGYRLTLCRCEAERPAWMPRLRTLDGVVRFDGPIFPRSEAAHTWGQQTMKANRSKLIFEIEIGNVFYLFAVGMDHIAISMRPVDQWAAVPDHMRLCFAIPTPEGMTIPDNPLSPGVEVYTIVRHAIEAAAREMKEKGTASPLPDATPKRPRPRKPEPHEALRADNPEYKKEKRRTS